MGTASSTKRVLITGCSSGFGLLTAVQAAKSGFQVVATMRDLGKKANLVQALGDARVTAEIAQLDVTDPAGADRIVKEHAPIDILVNNAGIVIVGSILDLSDEELRRVFETNYFGAVRLIKAVLPGMITRRSGMIINVASGAGRVGHMFNATYSASKHALVGLSRSIRLELKPFNIKVVSVEPGYHKTEIVENNINLAAKFSNTASPMFEFSRGYRQMMLKKVLPLAADPNRVTERIVRIMSLQNPRLHYVIGWDAKLVITLQWLGLESLFGVVAYWELLHYTEKVKKQSEQS